MRILVGAALLASLVFPFASHGQSALPPRTAGDIVALLRSAPVNPDELVAAGLVLQEAIPVDVSGRTLANIHLQRARAAEALGLTDRYLAEYRAAWLASGKSIDSADLQLRVEYVAAEVHSGNIMAALLAMEDAAARGTTAGARLAALGFLVENKARHGKPDEAAIHLRQAEKEFSDLRRSTQWGIWGDAWESNIERARGGFALGSGKFSEAETHFRKSADAREKDIAKNQLRLDTGRETLTQRLVVGLMLIARKGVADMLLQQGRLVESEMLYREILARALSEFGSGSSFPMIYTEGLANVLLEQGRAADVSALAAAALQLMEQRGMAPESRLMTAMRQRLAAAHVALGEWPAAYRQYEAIRMVLARDSELTQRLGRGNKSWALTLMRVGQPDAAVRMMENLVADDSRRFADDDQQMAETRGFYAMALATAARPGEALAQYRKAVPILLAAQRDAGEEGVTASMRRVVLILESYLDLLYRLHLEQAGPADLDIPAEAFRVADAARASSVQKALLASAARGAVRDLGLARLVRDEQDLSYRIGMLNETLSRLLSSPPGERLDKIVGDMRRDLPRFKDERKLLRERIDREFPEYSILISPRTLFPADVQGLLKPDEAMLAVYVGERRTYLWGIPRVGAPVFAVSDLGSGAIAERVASVRRGLDPGASDVDVNFDLATAHLLYAQIVKPVAAGFAGARNLLIVPHGALGQLPFALLPTQAGDPGKSTLPFDAYLKTPWLIRDLAVTQLPSVSTLLALRRVAPARESGQRPFLGFGDPWFNARHAAPAGQEYAQARLSGRSIGVRFGPGTRSASSAGIGDLARLPDTATEVREIASALQADSPESIRLGKAASESAVKESKLADYRIVAFATHGLVPGDLNGLAEPALALSNPALTGEQNADGLLTMTEILGLRMNADWVVLSACNTASGDGSSAEAVSGLGRAFFYAGTRALLVTNWPVETVSARLLTTELFRRQAEQPDLSRAEALRGAMLSVMERHSVDQTTGKPDYSYAHPMFWAPYSLIGDGGR